MQIRICFRCVSNMFSISIIFQCKFSIFYFLFIVPCVHTFHLMTGMSCIRIESPLVYFSACPQCGLFISFPMLVRNGAFLLNGNISSNNLIVSASRIEQLKIGRGSKIVRVQFDLITTLN